MKKDFGTTTGDTLGNQPTGDQRAECDALEDVGALDLIAQIQALIPEDINATVRKRASRYEASLRNVPGTPADVLQLCDEIVEANKSLQAAAQRALAIINAMERGGA